MIKFILIIFSIMFLLGIGIFIQAIIFGISLVSNKNEILEGVKKYDSENYNLLINHRIPYRKRMFKVIRKLCEDGEIKNDRNILYFFSKYYKIFLIELIILVFLMIISSVIIQLYGKRVA